MTSRFVSGGTIASDGAPAPASPPPPSASNPQWDRDAARKHAEWEAVQRELEVDRRRRADARKSTVEGGGAGAEKSLYEVLQANKAAKQAAFEEQNRIRNQFRALDDDEVDFLEGVRDERRGEEERVRRETEERLASFRRAQMKTATATATEMGDEVATRETGTGTGEQGEGEGEGDVVAWAAAGRKRKREREAKGVVKGVVKRRVSGGLEKKKEEGEQEKVEVEASSVGTATRPKSESSTTTTTTTEKAAEPPQAKPGPKPKPKLGLVDYGSDEDDDD
ncbi:hypothetical protein F4779DRAFT_633074 [Xylariaceae sp. FL0662B]|nr:hypothetical protein F4779DRAFT_633074 [Xylariaceae sp. FL0662B]